jgi:hypothetical protein
MKVRKGLGVSSQDMTAGLVDAGAKRFTVYCNKECEVRCKFGHY